MLHAAICNDMQSTVLLAPQGEPGGMLAHSLRCSLLSYMQTLTSERADTFDGRLHERVLAVVHVSMNFAGMDSTWARISMFEVL